MKQVVEDTPKTNGKRIAVDFDDVLCDRNDYPRGDFSLCLPMPHAVSAVSWLVSQGYAVYVLTMNPPESWGRISAWLETHGFPQLMVTNVKQPGTKWFIDDRAIRFTTWKDVVKYFG